MEYESEPQGLDIAVNSPGREPFATGSHTLPLACATTMSRSASTTSSISSLFRHHPYSTSRPRSTTSASGSSRSGTEESSESASGEGDSLPEVALMDLDDSQPGDLPCFSLSAPPATAPAPRGRAPAKPKVKASHARKTSPDHIKRPPNAFIMFRSHCCNPAESGEAPDAPGTPSAVQLAGLGITDHRHISRIASILWKALPPLDKGYWERRARERKEEHLLQHPGYKYKPVFRNKDDIRRRKKAYADEMETEKRGCEEVARALMCAPDHLADQTNQAAAAAQAQAAREASESAESSGGGSAERDWRDEEFRSNQSRVANPPPSIWTLDQVKPLAAALSTAPPPLEASPKRKRTRPSTASSNSRRRPEDEHAHEGSYSIHSSGQPQQFLGDSYAHHQPPQDFRPHSAPAGEYAPFGSANDQRRRGSHLRATSYNHLSANGDGAYSNALELDAPYYGSQLHQHQRAVSSQPYSSQSQYQPTYAAPPPRRPAPTPLIPHNPSFLYYHPQQAGDSHQAHFEPSLAQVQLSPRSLAMAQMQSYTLEAQPVDQAARHRSPSQEVVLSPTGTTFTYDGAIEDLSTTLPTTAEHEEREAPNLSLAGMKRRGTLGRTVLGGDLMLISPTTATFATGRKFSLGRWEVRKVSVDGQLAPAAASSSSSSREPHPLSRSPRGSFSFDGAFIQSVQPGEREDDEEQEERSRGGYAPSPEYHGRPNSATSDYSSGSSIHEPEPRAEGGPPSSGEYWRRGSEIKDDERPFHVGHSDFFLPPAPPLLSRPFAFNRDSSDLGQSSMFNYPSFGGAGYSTTSTHRPSIDALLAADAYAPYLHGGPSEEWLSNRVGRDSDATIKWNPRRESVVPDDVEEEQDDEIRISALSTTREQALKVLEHSMRMQDSAEDEGCRYIYLSKELSTDTSLIEQILHAGFGVTYDHSGAPTAPTVDYDPQTARQETFDTSPTSLTSPPSTFASI